MIDLDAALAAAQRPQKTVSLCLRGDLVAEIESLDEQIEKAEAERADSMGRTTELKRLRKRRDELVAEAEAEDSKYPFVITGLSDPEWQELISAHPARDDNDADGVFGYNTSTFFDALVRAALGSSVTEAQWIKLRDTLSSGQMEELRDAALKVSRRRVDIPKSPPSSADRRRSDAT